MFYEEPGLFFWSLLPTEWREGKGMEVGDNGRDIQKFQVASAPQLLSAN